MNKKIAVIGGSYLQRPLIEEIIEQGHTPIVFSWIDDEKLNHDVKFYNISVTDHDQIVKYCKKESVSAVVSIASDLTALSTAYVAEQLGCITTPYKTICQIVDKYKMREALKYSNIKYPKYVRLNNISQEDFIDIDFPMIVKPTDRSGSRGVTLVRDKSKFIEAVQRALSCSFTHNIIIESFIEGLEYSIETLTYCGSHQIIAITEKITTGEPFFVELGHFQPTSLTIEVKEKIHMICETILNDLKIQYGASHIELKIQPNGDIFLIEVGPRMGGDMIGSNLTYLSTGYNYLKNVIDISLGKEPEIFKNQKQITGIGICFIHVEKKSIINRIREKHENTVNIVKKEYNIKSGDSLNSVNESSNRYGYIIYKNSNFLDFNHFLEIEFSII